jgi:hypothetical protein
MNLNDKLQEENDVMQEQAEEDQTFKNLGVV